MRVSVRYASQTNSTFVATSVFSSTDN
jgi:hypothetical protein